MFPGRAKGIVGERIRARKVRIGLIVEGPIRKKLEQAVGRGVLQHGRYGSVFDVVRKHTEASGDPEGAIFRDGIAVRIGNRGCRKGKQGERQGHGYESRGEAFCDHLG